MHLFIYLKILTWIRWHSWYLSLPVWPMSISVFAFHHTRGVLLWRMSAAVQGTEVWLGGSKAGRGVLMPQRWRLPLSVEQFSWLTGKSLLCLTWNEKEFSNDLKSYNTDMLNNFTSDSLKYLLSCIIPPFPFRKGLRVPSKAGLNCPFWGTRLWYTGESWYPFWGCSTVRPTVQQKEK